MFRRVSDQKEKDNRRAMLFWALAVQTIEYNIIT